MVNGGLGQNFDYIWIVRCRGKSFNRNVECSLSSETPTTGLKPLIEVVSLDLFKKFYIHLKKRHDEVMVDFPLYLSEKQNRFSESIQHLISAYHNPVQFFLDFQQFIDVPVVSASHSVLLDYHLEKTFLQKLKAHFGQLAVRVRVPTFDLSGVRPLLQSYRSLLNGMRDEDTLLLDVFSISGIENQIDSNLKLMSSLAKSNNLKTFVLNAFEPYNDYHNFGPLFTYRYGLDGFGDFATEKRFPAKGGTAPRKIIRYYYWDTYTLKEFVNNSYPNAALQLRTSNYWVNHKKHQQSCQVCAAVDNGVSNNGHVYWKKFRVLHYLNSITTETQRQFVTAASEEDLDPDGYDTLFNVGRI